MYFIGEFSDIVESHSRRKWNGNMNIVEALFHVER
ncbi:hypothetical protein J2T13_000028 [Paenibacillus sp. DS2015]